MINQKAEAEACNFCNDDDDNCHSEETILDSLRKGYFKLHEQKCDLEKCLDEALKKHRNAMDEVKSLIVRNQKLRKELDDIDVLSSKVQTELNKTIRTSVEKIKKLQNVIYSMTSENPKNKSEAKELKCKQKHYQEEMECIVGENEKLKNSLRKEINDKQTLMCRMKQLEKTEQELRKEIECLMRTSVDQKQMIKTDDHKLHSLDYEGTNNKQSLDEPQFYNNLKTNNKMKTSKPIRVTVTGAAGQIAYSLLYMIANGDVFGSDQPLILHLLDIPPMVEVLQGVVMELADCALPLLAGVVATVDLAEAFKDVSAVFLVGSIPRTQGMERKDLLSTNVKIFKVQGEALDQYAKKDVKVLVIGNPANTNALVCSKYAPSIPKKNFTSMTRLDQNRAQAQIAAKAGVSVSNVFNVIIWGNHSPTQVPDASIAKVVLKNKTVSASEAVQNENWLMNEFIQTVQKRGTAVITARKLSSAMSAAKAAVDHMRDWFRGTEPGKYVSMGVYSDGSYGAPKDVVFSFPVEIKDGEWKIVQNLPISDYNKQLLKATGKELEEERAEAFAVIGS